MSSARSPSVGKKLAGGRYTRESEDYVDPNGDEPGEFVCPADEGGCGRRCTRGPSGTEYGHARTERDNRATDGGRCPRRPAPEVVDPVRYAEAVREGRSEVHREKDAETGRFVPADEASAD